MKKITVSAPGKLMLFGEHAVVYNRPCLVTAVNQRLNLEAEIIKNQILLLEAPDVQIQEYQKELKDLGKGDIPKAARFVEMAVKNFLTEYQLPAGLKIKTRAEFSAQFGFGSSSASTVCVLKGLSEIAKIKLTNKEIFDLSYKTVLDIQGKGSGFDVAAAIYGGTIYFWTGGKIIEPINIDSIPLVVGYSGIKADTVTLINQVKEKADKNPELVEGIYNRIEEIVNQAKEKILKKEWDKVGDLMNKNHHLLKQLGVSIDKLDKMCQAALDAGAYGAKLSGAGGGDCMIALVSEEKREQVARAIEKAGGIMIEVKVNAEGVRIEV